MIITVCVQYITRDPGINGVIDTMLPESLAAVSCDLNTHTHTHTPV